MSVPCLFLSREIIGLQRTSVATFRSGISPSALVDASEFRRLVVRCWCSFLNCGFLSSMEGSQGGIILLLKSERWIVVQCLFATAQVVQERSVYLCAARLWANRGYLSSPSIFKPFGVTTTTIYILCSCLRMIQF